MNRPLMAGLLLLALLRLGAAELTALSEFQGDFR